MNAILLYLAQVIVGSGILYGYYHLVLRNREFHEYNRFYLLSAAVISLLLPLLQIPVYFENTNDTSAQVLLGLQSIRWMEGDEVIVTTNASSSLFSFSSILYYSYIVVGAVLLIRLIVALAKIKRLLNRHQVEKLEGVDFVNTEEPGTPFTFFRWLFWDRKIALDSEHGKQVFRHEVFHIQQKHSWDVMVMEVLRTFFWINPFFHVMKKELRTIHEFLADRFAIAEQEKWSYAEFLLMQALETRNKLVNPFFHSQIKRRIAMITQSQKTSHRYLRKVLALPLALLVLGLVAFQVKQEVTEIQLKEDVVINNMNDAAVDEQTISIIDTVPAKANSRLKLKGVATPGKEPLYVIDGITVGEKNKALLDTLNPDRIESISVIKNAEATALYGKDAENGVIIISTKKSPATEQEVVLVGRPKYETRLSEVKLSPVKTNEEVVVEGRPSTVKEVVVQGYKKPKENANIQVDEVIVEGHKIEKAEGKEVVVQGIKSTKTAPKEEVREVTVQGYQSKRVTVSDVPSEMNEVVVVGYSKNDTKTEPLFEAVEEAAQPQGGKDGWVKYLQRNLNANIAVENNAPIGKYTVQVRFIVEKDGSINKITPITLHGYGMEEEAVRVIKASGTWIPAKQNGREVRSYRQQPITFVVEKESKPVALKLSPAEVADEIKSSGTLYPNPADGTFTISLRSEKNTDATVQVLTMNGASTGILKKVNLIKGNNSISMPTGSLKTGTYIVNIAVENNKPEVYKLIKN